MIDRWLDITSNGKQFLPYPDTERIWKAGGGWCHQAVQILEHVLNDFGIESVTHLSDLHVILGVQTQEGKSILLDPDIGIVLNTSIDQLEIKEHHPAIVAQLIEKGWKEDKARELADIYFKANWEQPKTSWIEYKKLLELSNRAGYLISLTLMVSGLILLMRSKRAS